MTAADVAVHEEAIVHLRLADLRSGAAGWPPGARLRLTRARSTARSAKNL